jgi:hypothetical protein
MTTNSDPTNDIVALISGIADLPVDIKVAALNRIREALLEPGR